jgi:hypothetical protein
MRTDIGIVDGPSAAPLVLLFEVEGQTRGTREDLDIFPNIIL